MEDSIRESGSVKQRLLTIVKFALLCTAFGTLAPIAVALQTQDPLPSKTSVAAASPTATPVNWSEDPMLRRFKWRGIGPASMGGRIDDIAVVESNPYIIYIGFATGGVWKSTNNGTTFQPIFDTYSTASIGDVEVSQSDPNIVWVGTGEPNNRQSSSFGDGIYKSMDAGATFIRMGLEDSQTIARMVIDPKNPNIVYVAVPGHLFGPNKERGIYKTMNGGKTWANINFMNEDTGFTDLVMDPSDNTILYAASYQRRRTSWGFNGGGPGSCIWKTTDAGKTWKKIEGNGLPDGMLGRIGLDVSRSNPNIIYAQIEVAPRQGTGGEEQVVSRQEITPIQSGSPSPSPVAAATPVADPKESGVWRSDDKGKNWRVVSNENQRPMYFSKIRVDPKNAENVYVGGLGFSRSTDGGKTFKSLQSGIPHPDHHAIWIDPNNTKHIILGNDGGLNVSYDQGGTWEYINTIPSAQFYAVAADLRKPYYVYGGLQDNGTWSGPSQTRHHAGITNADWFQVGGGDGFYAQVDPTDYAIIYFESQNGAMARLDLRTGESVSIRPRGTRRQSGQRQGGAEGRTSTPPTAMVSPTASLTPEDSLVEPAVPAGPMAGGGPGSLGALATSNVVPPPTPGETYRFYWSTPLVISPHNPRILYAGANRLFKSLNRGDTWTATVDLTKHIDRSTLSIMGVSGKDPMLSKNDGYSSYGSIVTLAESPKLAGVLWVGTDDGNVQVSRDGGATWSNVSKNVPGIGDKYHISRVEPSHFDGATCYLAVDGHRFDDLKPYAFVTRDFGAIWIPIANNLPSAGNVNVIREDPVNKELLYVGTEYGLFVSLNSGSQWKRFMSGMPTTRVDDILVHPRDNDLIVGTHGRGIFILDDVTPLQQLSSINGVDSDAYLFEIRPATLWLIDTRLSRAATGAKAFRGANPIAGTAISYYFKSIPAGDVKIEISDYRGRVVRNIVGTRDSGINRVQWNLRGDPPPPPANLSGGRTVSSEFINQGVLLKAGTYLVRLLVGGKEYTTKVVIEADTPLSP